MLQDPPSDQAAKLDSLREQAIATRQLLDIIRASSDDEGPVFDAILDSAQRLCDTPISGLILATPEDSFQTLAAQRNVPEGAVEMFNSGRMPVDRNASYAARSIIDGRLIQFEDMGDSDLYREGATVVRAMVDQMRIRSVLFVPLMQNGRAIGTITLFRHKIQPFDPHQIELVETFASQAVIAIEKVRQFREVRLRLERERASAEILEAISRCRDDETPVFEAVLRNARILCRASTSALLLGTPEDRHLRLVRVDDADVDQKVSDAHMERARSQPIENDPELHVSAVAVCRGETVHVADLRQTDWYARGVPSVRYIADEVGQRTTLSVPLRDGDSTLGAINLHRRIVAPFSEDEVALVRAFATQAVIAIQNVRQFREVQERLAREIASRDVLQVISESRSDDAPVFQAILGNAARLCGAPMAWLLLLDEAQTTLSLAAHHGLSRRALEIGQTWALDLERERSGLGQAIVKAQATRDDDLKLTSPYLNGSREMVQLVDEEGLRSRISVPLVREGRTIGVIVLSRREVLPFSDDEIRLVDMFAGQAVIAIENVRQFREVQERLAREQSTREVLEVISRSRDDDLPVFKAILERAQLLCDAQTSGLQLLNDAGTHAVVTATHGLDGGSFPKGMEVPMSAETPVTQAIREARMVHLADTRETESYKTGEPHMLRMVDGDGVLTRLVVPLIKDKEAIGTISLSRLEQRPFTDDQIALVQTFAAQAVIAIENVRQFREVQTRLERERATGEVLQVISQSRDDETPVFDAILRHAETLCRAPVSALILAGPDDATQTLAAHRGARPEAVRMFETGQMPMDASQSYTAKCIIEGKIVALRDMGESDLYKAGSPVVRAMVDDVGVRSVIFAPLIREGRSIGAVTVYRKGIDPFDDTEVALLETFAAQAVIAIENVRQFRALETLNAELGDRVAEQVGELERMGKLKRFLPPAVADTVLTQGSDKMLSSHRALLGVLFCDIRGFTAFCETAEPEETIEVLQTYHEEMGKLINAHGAGVDHRMGDGIMVLFNDPLPCEDPAGDALRLAIAMRARMAELCKGWKRMGHRLGFGVGISLGYATVGMVGFEGRFDYTASGTAVNLASRLCDEAADGEILLSPRAAVAVEDDHALVSMGEAQLKGLREPLEIFRLDMPAPDGTG